MKNKIMYGLAGALALLTLAGCGPKGEVEKTTDKKGNTDVVVDKNTVYTNSEIAVFLGDEINLSDHVVKSYTAIVDGELEDLENPIENGILSTEFSNKASDLAGNKKAYIKHTLDEDGKVKATYGCIKEEGKDELCIIAYKNKEFANNKAALEKYFAGQEDACVTEDGEIECDNGTVMISNSEDIVNVYDYENTFLCQIDFELGASCSVLDITAIGE